MGACPPPLRGRSAVLSPNAADPSGGPKIDSHVDFDSTAAWRHHVSMPPSSRSQSAATTALAGGTCELFRVKLLPEIPPWWILGRCLPVNLLFYTGRIESSLALNPRSRRIVSSTPRNRSISVRLLAPTLAILHLLGLRAAPLPR